jgi:hypothetical protein
MVKGPDAKSGSNETKNEGGDEEKAGGKGKERKGGEGKGNANGSPAITVARARPDCRLDHVNITMVCSRFRVDRLEVRVGFLGFLGFLWWFFLVRSAGIFWSFFVIFRALLGLVLRFPA